MKTLIKALLAGSACLLIPLCATAQQKSKAGSDYQLPEFKIMDIAVLPEPAQHPIPSVSSRYVGTELDIKMNIDAKGNPSGIRLVRSLCTYSDVHLMSFAVQMRDLMSDWKFAPAEDARGNPVAVKVLLPVRVVKKAGTTAMQYAILLDDAPLSAEES